jgi:hypothetical protein
VSRDFYQGFISLAHLHFYGCLFCLKTSLWPGRLEIQSPLCLLGEKLRWARFLSQLFLNDAKILPFGKGKL